MLRINFGVRKKVKVVFLIASLLVFNNSQAQITGCTDPLALNYNPLSNVNDGSCIYYPASLLPALSFSLAGYLSGNSGLIMWNNHLWTHNDIEDINIYALDSINGNVLHSHALNGTVNIDWEEISQDNEYLYIGDFGNNKNGNRTDLKILRINKNSIQLNALIIDTIHFSYSDQNDLNPSGSNKTDFDCEAFIVSSDSIFLFTKQWISNRTSLYSLPKNPGIHIAKLKSTFDVKGLITGSVYLASKRLIVLSGYSALLEPFVYLLYDFNGSDYFGGNKRKISISLPYHQVEGLTTANGLKYYVSNEYFNLPPYLNIPQKLHVFYLDSYLERYLSSLTVSISESAKKERIDIYPNPTTGLLIIDSPQGIPDKSLLEVYDLYGRLLYSKQLLNSEIQKINLSQLKKGIYFLNIRYSDKNYYRKIIIE